MIRQIFFLFLGLALAMTTQAGTHPGADQWTAGVTGSHFVMGDSGAGAVDDLKDFSEIGVSAWRFLSPDLSAGVELGYGGLETKYLGGDVDGYRFGAGGRWHLGDYSVWGIRPLLGAGLNVHQFDSDTFDTTKTETSVYGEIGGQKVVSGRWLIEAGVRSRVEVEDTYNDTQLFAGVSYVFGATEKPAPAPKPEPEPAPVIEPEPKPEPKPAPVVTPAKPEPKVVATIMLSDKTLTFKTGSAELPENADLSRLGEFADAVKKSSSHSILIEGHTDSTGPAAYNQRLSVERAESVKQLLIGQFAVNPDRIETRGLGETQPVADNRTAEGREANRRVEVKLRDANQ